MIKYDQQKLINTYTSCSLCWRWRLLLECCKRKTLLAGWWPKTAAGVLWEENNTNRIINSIFPRCCAHQWCCLCSDSSPLLPRCTSMMWCCFIKVKIGDSCLWWLRAADCRMQYSAASLLPCHQPLWSWWSMQEPSFSLKPSNDASC